MVLLYIFYALLCLITLLILLKVYNKATMGWCYSQVCLKGKTVLITGANAGIGFQTALDVAKRGSRVILACRNEEKAKQALDDIIKQTNNHDVTYKLVDFTSFKSIRNFARDVIATEPRLDVLINNAGAGGLADQITEDGLLITMQVNYFGPFLLTNLLLGLLKKSPSSRIVNVASVVAKYANVDVENINKYEGDMDQYFRSKLCNVLFTIELAMRLENSNVTVYSLHPGVVRTEIFRTMPYMMRKITDFFIGILYKSALEGAQTSIHVAVANGLEEFNGQQFHDCRPVARYSSCTDTLAKQLWEKSVEIVNLNVNE